MNRQSRLARFAPRLPELSACDSSNFSRDLMAGVSVAAVALPVGVAYAQLAGFRPEVGLYASILPLVAYALFGSSRQLSGQLEERRVSLVGRVTEWAAHPRSRGLVVALRSFPTLEAAIEQFQVEHPGGARS